ncbi:hypothetical protein FACS1894178_1820 [Bacteroidia bacterium]|nr:hypothetical protein FACS1894178_1820 [Bacteroidia bacterium]
MNIYLNNEFINSIEIINDEGKTIKKQVVNAEKIDLDISDLKASNYLIKIVTKNSTHIKKWLKNRE